METSKHRNSKTLLVNIFVERKFIGDYSGIRMNTASDHKAIFILHTEKCKYLEIERCTDEDMTNMTNESKHPNVLNALNNDSTS